MNRNLFRSKLVARGDSLVDMSCALGISPQELQNKLSGKHDFTATQIHKCIQFMSLTPDDVISIFFNDEVE